MDPRRLALPQHHEPIFPCEVRAHDYSHKGYYYRITDTGKKLGALTDGDTLDNVSTIGFYDTGKVVENVSFLRLFSECQGTFKGYFADIIYYRDQDGMIFSRDTTYPQYQALKASQGNGGVMYEGGGEGSFGGGSGRWWQIIKSKLKYLDK